jgi:hypothetical protein
MNKQMSKKVKPFLTMAIAFMLLAASVHAQKKCNHGKCPSGYACSPIGTCYRIYCKTCLPFVTELESDTDGSAVTPSTGVKLQLNKTQAVSVRIYDLAGRLIRKLVDESIRQGSYQVNWDTKDANDRRVASGIYIEKVLAENYSQTKKIVVD